MRNPLRVFYLYPYGPFFPITSGSDVVAANHLEYFRTKGAEVQCVLFNNNSKDQYLEEFKKKYSWCRSIDVLNIPQTTFSLGNLLFSTSLALKMPIFSSWANREFDLAFTNYAFTAPIIYELKKSKCKVLEAHDVLCEAIFVSNGWEGNHFLAQKALQGIEWDLYRVFNSVTFINREEFESAPKIPGCQMAWIPPAWPFEASPQKGADVDGDLLFLGSGHLPNIEGIDFFYHKVYLPFLRSKGVRLTMAGKVSQEWRIEDPLINKLGFYNGPISDLYSSAKVIVIPILQGSGFSIKTMEAMAFGKAIVTTPKGLRGMAKEGAPVEAIDMEKEPQKFAQKILRLLESQEERMAIGEKTKEYFLREHSFATYSKRMDQFLRLAA